MFPILFPVYLTFTLAIIVVNGEFMSINWNKSTVRGNSDMEREYKYPMYEKVAPSSCDLTDSCDVSCCQDPDCDEAQKQSFQCSESPEHNLFSFDCNSDYYDKPEWMPWFCYVFRNPVYLGKFYSTPSKIEKISVLKSKTGNKVKSLGDRRASKPKAVLQYGSPIMTYSPMINSFPSVAPLMMKTPIHDSSPACVLTPVKYRQKGVTTCLEQITPDLCENSQSLGVAPFLIQNTTMFRNINAPVVLKSLDFLEGIKTEVQIKCIKPKSHTKKFRKVKLHIFQQDSVCEETIDTYRTAWKKPVCENVLAYVHHHFTVNGSDLVKLKVEYGVMNISVPSDVLDEFSGSYFHQYIYIKQVFNITFHDIMNSTHNSKNSSENLISRGYFIGEELNFGYKSFENSSAIWRKGFVGIFKNGRSCEKSPITFGFDSLSTCQISTKFSNCTQLRNAVLEKFDDLLQGELMAVNGDLRAPYNDTVPLLRNYPNGSREHFPNSSLCSVPLRQDFLIQYTTLVTKNGLPIHKIIGVRVDRPYENVSLPGALTLTSRVLYFFVSSSTEKPLSRFWTRMYSPELSENSWLNIYKAFDDVNTVEREEITLWCIFLTISVSIAVAITRLDVNLAVLLRGRKRGKIGGKETEAVINLPYEKIWRLLLTHPIANRDCCR